MRKNKLKHKHLYIATITFFVVVNTSQLWAAKIGVFAMLSYLLLLVWFIILSTAFFIQLFMLIKEKFNIRKRVYLTVLMAIVLASAFILPLGLINYEIFESETILNANREGAANCTTIFKLNKDHTFKEKNICFGITEITGNYSYINDTIFFEKINLGRNENKYYEFAIIKPSLFNDTEFDLVLFENKKDTVGKALWITYNQMKKPITNNNLIYVGVKQ